MTKLFLASGLVSLLCNAVFARTFTDDEAGSAWNEMKKSNVTEENFKQTCDLIQDVAQTNINVSYEILAQYQALWFGLFDKKSCLELQFCLLPGRPDGAKKMRNNFSESLKVVSRWFRHKSAQDVIVCAFYMQLFDYQPTIK